MKILGIESTCDETSCSIVEDGEKILSHTIFSQETIHQKFGGVFPEHASREHIEKMLPCIDRTLQDAGLTLSDIDAIAVAYTPGLMGSILMGVTCAQALSYTLGIPLIGVNHIEAHLYAAMMGAKKIFPALGLVVSGGHTFLALIHKIGSYELLSTTVDDAVGESFDKVASMLDLPYPGGPHIERLAQCGDDSKFPFKAGRVKNLPLHFSFSGLKTNVLYTVQEQSELSEQTKADIAASFQRAAFSDICKKIEAALKQYDCRALYCGGGVTMNQKLRTLLTSHFTNIPCHFPDKNLSLDNAAMIAGLAFHKKEIPIDQLTPAPRTLPATRNGTGTLIFS